VNKKLTPAEVAEVYGIPVRTLDQWRYLRKGPRWSRIGRYVRYDAADVEAYFEQQSHGGAS
jgi:predicted DNA-binding transcriptional regulator AlpA